MSKLRDFLVVRKGYDISPNAAFWALITMLLVCSLFFAISVETRRGGWSTFTGAVAIPSGDPVTLTRVIDGDEVSVARADGSTYVVRLLGIKCFDPRVTEPGLGDAGLACKEATERSLQGKAIQVVYEGELKKDRHDRVLAYLDTEDGDVGRRLIEDGHAMAYVRYDHAREGDYLAAVSDARTARRGIWGSARPRARAEALQAAWSVAREEAGE